MPTYAITADLTEVNEGTTTTFTVATTEVDNGTPLYWTIAGTNVGASDFVSASTSGFVTITGNAASFTTTVQNDTTLEGYEYYIAQLRTDSTTGTIVAVSQNIVITDTSNGVPPLTLANGRIGSLSSDAGQLIYTYNDVVYKVDGTLVSF